MNLVIIHYHLNRGGVTSVIRNQINALATQTPVKRVLVLHGPGVEGWPSPHTEFEKSPLSVEFTEMESLGYQSDSHLETNLSAKILSHINDRGFELSDTLIQIHNHNLGKNNSLMVAIRELAKKDCRILLQIHDFAEDMRPDNYVAIQSFCRLHHQEPNELIFPQFENVHFAFLNHRDQNLVRDHYVDKQKCHFLPNPVSIAPLNPESDSRSIGNGGPPPRSLQIRRDLGCSPRDQLAVYPVRAIRRKNVAEAILFAVANPETRMAVTLPAVSPDERPTYEKIKSKSSSLGLPVVFEAGQKGIEFTDLIQASDFVFTSSVAEGFGMVFLEAWCLGKQLAGRNLESITRDFVDCGLKLNSLYQDVRIPLDWIDANDECQRQQEMLQQVLDQFAVSSELKIRFEEEMAQGWIDFAKLRVATQLSVIERVWDSDECRAKLLAMNEKFRLPTVDNQMVEHNSKVVRMNFDADSFRQRFLAIMEQVLSPASSQSINIFDHRSQDELVESFLDPKQFFPLRVER